MLRLARVYGAISMRGARLTSSQLFAFDLRKSNVLLTTYDAKFGESNEEISSVSRIRRVATCS